MIGNFCYICNGGWEFYIIGYSFNYNENKVKI